MSEPKASLGVALPRVQYRAGQLICRLGRPRFLYVVVGWETIDGASALRVRRVLGSAEGWTFGRVLSVSAELGDTEPAKRGPEGEAIERAIVERLALVPHWAAELEGVEPDGAPVSVHEPASMRGAAITLPEHVARLPEIAELAEDRERETLLAVLLDGQGRKIRVETVAVGSLNVARAVPADVIRPMLRWGAIGAVLVHNHPSGDPTPSEDDRKFTRVIGRALAGVGLYLTDHIVVSSGGAWRSHLAIGVAW